MLNPRKCGEVLKTGKYVKVKQMTQSPPHSSEEKILNASSKQDVIMNVCDAFEDVLNKLNIVSRDEKIYEKLCAIQNLIQLKISHLQFHDSSVLNPEFQNLSLPGFLGSSTQSLCSEISTSYLDNDPDFTKFLKQVNCPFCKQSQSDKMKLISHLHEFCRPLMNKLFTEKEKHLAYSVFQILPNNSLKCNVCMNSVYSKIKQYFLHSQSQKHKTNYSLIKKKRVFTQYFFCSCCKVLVPDNYTEFECHVNHQVHNTRSKLAFDRETYLKKGIQCVYMRNKKFNCIQCNLKFVTPSEVLNHLEDKNHMNMKRQKVRVFLVFCEFCQKEVLPYEVLKHFSSPNHIIAEKKDTEEYFEMCIFCGFICDKLSELAKHMETNCNEINKLRKLVIKTNFNENNSQIIKPNKEEDTKENRNPEQINYIIIKDNTKLSELYSYFKEIGEIRSIEIYNKINAIIHFKEKTSVDDVLLLRDVIKINGVKVEITTEKEEEEEEMLEKQQKKNAKKYKEKSNSNNKTENVSGSESEESDPSRASCDEDSLNEETRKLFQRVSSHLLKNLHKVDPILEQILLRDIGDTFHCQSCALIGFSGCELSFPLENISIYCEVSDLLSSNSDSINSDSITYITGVTQILFSRLMESPLWEDLVCSLEAPFPCIECKHKRTKTTCIFTFMRPAKVVSDLLRYYLKKSDIIKSFVLITRFWISVHELGIKEHEFAIISLLISFLVYEDIVEPNTALNYKPVVFHFCEALRALNVDDRSQKKNRNNVITAEALFHRFLRFIYEFDFAKNIIYLPFKRPVPKSILKKAPICSILANCETIKSTSSVLCVIDPFLNVNLTSGVSKEDLEVFLETIKVTLRKT